MKSDLSADQHRVAATGSTAFAMENAALRAENERMRAALYAVRGAARYGPPSADTLKTICDYVDAALSN